MRSHMLRAGGFVGMAASPPTPGTAAISSQASGTTFTPSMPTHSAGQVIVAILSIQGTTDVTATGWTSAASFLNGSVRAKVFFKLAASSSETISVSNTNNAQITAHIYALSGAGSASADFENATATATDNPPALTPTTGLNGYCWFAIFATNNANITGGPTGYTTDMTNTQTSARLGSGWFRSTATTEDPSTFSGPAGADRALITLSVRAA